MNTQKSRSLNVLKEEALSFPFLSIIALFFILLIFNFSLTSGGAGNLLETFVVGRYPNAQDFTKKVALLVTNSFSYFHSILGGQDPGISRILFKLGHSWHVILPLLYLCFLRYKDEVSDLLFKKSITFYAVSLLFSHALSAFVVVNHFRVAHSVGWLCLFCLQSIKEDGSTKLKEKFLFNFSLLLAFTAPIGFLSLALILANSFEKKVVEHPRLLSWRLWITGLLVLVFLCYLLPTSLINHINVKFNLYPGIPTIFYVSLFMISLFLRPNQRNFWLIFCYLLFGYFSWKDFMDISSVHSGYTYSCIFILIIQYLYLFKLQSLTAEKLSILRNAINPMLALMLITMTYQALSLEHFLRTLDHQIEGKKGFIQISELKGHFPARYSSLLDTYLVSIQALHLSLQRSKHIDLLVSHGDFFGPLKVKRQFPPRFFEGAVKKKITFSEELLREK